MLRAGVYLALAGTVLFFALTRTEVGRDKIRQQLQSAFDERFAGSLRIGTLTGTLLYDLRASEVRLRDASGRLVATVDSVSTSPHWSDLLSAELSVGDITLIRPHLTLHRYADSTWNVERALTRTSPSSSTNRSLAITAPDITIREGRITTTRTGPAPQSVSNRWLFDYTRSGLDSLQAEATVEWNRSTPRIEVASLAFRLPEHNLSLSSTQGQFEKRGNRWHLTSFSLQLGNTQLRAEGTLHAPSRLSQSSVDLQLTEGRLDYDELQRLVPRLPFQDVVTVEGRVGGSLDRFVVNQLTMSHNRSTLAVEGTAFGLPDSLNLEAQLLKSTIHAGDVRTVWPNAPLDRVGAIGPIQLGATVDGIVEWRAQTRPSFNLEGTLFAQGRPGTIRGSLDVARTSTRPLQYSASLQTDSLNLAPLTQNPRLESRLTSTLSVQGQGAQPSTLRSTVQASLSESHLGFRRVSAATLELQVEDQTVQGTASFRQPAGGRLTLEGSLDATASAPLYELTAAATDFDLAGTARALPSTQLNATLATQGRGQAWNTLAGRVELTVDTSRVQRGDSTTVLPPHRMALDLAPRSSSQPRLRLEGTLASAQVEGDLLHPVLRTSSSLWATTLRRAAREEIRAASRSPAPTDTSTASDALPGTARSRAQAAMTTTNRDAPTQLQATLSIHRMDLLRRWWPGAPSQADQFQATSSLTISPDTLAFQGNVRSARLQMGTSRFDSLATSFALSGPFRPNPFDALQTHLSVEADTHRVGDRALVGPSTELHLAQRTGTLQAEADGLGPMGPFRLASEVTVQGAPTFRITDLYAGAGQHAWINQSPSTIATYTDAIVVDSLNLESARPLAETTQKIRLDGTISSTSSDTLQAEFTDVLLYPVGQLANLSRPLGGRLTGRIAVTGGWQQPQVRSGFQVHRLTFDRRVLGDLRVRSRLMPNTPDLLLDAALTPGPSSLDSLSGPNLVPDGPRVIEENRLQLKGTIRLPGWAEATAPASDTSPDQLDLTATVDRADLFFFKYIFDENLAKAQGYTAGTIHVNGRFRRPIFNAEMQIHNGQFALPQFGLSYTASGPINVDRRGIHIQGLNVDDGRGSATLRGSVLFNDYRFFSFDLSAALDELQIVDVTNAEDLAFYGQIRASGSATLTGPLSNTTLRSESARTTPDSELFIPVSEGGVDDGTGFIVFADSTGQIPDLRDLTRRDNIFSDRPAGEPSFLEGMEIDINVRAPEESTVNLVFDPVVGDVVTAVGSGRIQLQRQEGEFFVYGDFNVTGGNYLFTAGEVFVRRFNINSGTLTWDGPPTNAQLDLEAEYRTRASPAGLPSYSGDEGRIPVRVQLDIGGRVETPQVDLSLGLVRDERDNLVGSQTLDAILNQADRTTEYATSVLLTNTFLLTTESFTQGRTTGQDGTTSGSLNTAGRQLAFNSVSQLVASQLNRYLGAALPNVDLNFGVQGEDPNDLDLIYGVALRLLNERLVIRGEGVYTGDDPDQRQAQGPQGEFVVELRLSNRVSVEAFYRRSGDELTRGQTLTSSTGAGLSYQTEFSTWRQLFRRVFGWLLPDDPNDKATPTTDPVARRDNEDSPEGTSTGTDPSTNERPM